MTEYSKEYERWLLCAKEFSGELKGMTRDQIEDAFYRDLEFGTAGLRGIIGAGINRMNEYTVAKTSQGLAGYVNRNYPGNPKIAVSYDCRIKSDVFSRVAASVFAANGIDVYIYPELMPTPCLSFAVRYYGCAAGVMVTASHNPAAYNGYKVYGPDGCQITEEAAEEILGDIEKLDVFADIKTPDSDSDKRIHFIGDDCADAFIAAVKDRSVLFGDDIDRNVAIVYSPLNGTGLEPVTRILSESGFTNVTVVEEQRLPDGNFPTCPYPNPEIRQALSLGLEYAGRLGADLMLATDPDADRVGIAVRDGGEMKLLTGNQTGILLLDFICSQRKKHGAMPGNPMLVKTIVTTDLADRIAEKYGVRTVNVLTGFKYIGEQIAIQEKAGHPENFIFGFEESYGYLSGSHVRDKDAVNASMLICEMFAYYKTRGISLIERLEEIYAEFGYCLNVQHSYTFEGVSGMARMADIMAGFRRGLDDIGGRRVEKILDYSRGIDGLPAADVLKFVLEGNCSAVIRPSGTEPKIKAYTSVCASDSASACAEEKRIVADLEKILK